MPGKLSTHVLDLTTGRPAAGMRIELWSLDGKPTLLKAVTTNLDGRTEEPLLAAATMIAGSYELLFFVKDYFVTHHKDSPFLDRVPVRFAIADAKAGYHVPPSSTASRSASPSRTPRPVITFPCSSPRGLTAPTAGAEPR